jgi:pilus assembly protein CpaC
MHHTNPFLRLTLGGLLLGVALGGTAIAQDAVQPPAPRAAQPSGRANAIIVPLNSTQRLQMSTRRRITGAVNTKEAVARLSVAANDPTSVLITGLEPGLTSISLTDQNNVTENFDVIVQLDVEYLRTLLQRAIPTALLTPIPAANNTIILAGTVAHAEDVDVIMRTAISVVGAPEKVVNAMRVGGVQQVQLDVCVARVARNQLRRMAFDFFETGQRHFFASTVGTGFAIPTPGQGIGGSFPGAPTIPNTIGTPNGQPSNLFLAVFNPTQNFFGLLQALKEDDLAKIMAKPTLVSLSGRPASFLDGGEQAVPIPAGLGQIGIQFEEFGTRLNFLPIVLGNGKIHLEVEPEVSQLDPA